LAQIEKQLSPEQIAQWRSQMKKQKVQIFLPKFTITRETISLIEMLKKLGIQDAFAFGKADFSGMNGTKDLAISDILHRAFVDVNEEGAEAAATTATFVWRYDATPPPIFRADHPFLFFIQDNATGSILFMGRVVNPAAQ